MSRQFGLGWSYNDNVLNAQTLVGSPPVGRIRMVEKVRFRFTHAGNIVWWLTHFGTPAGNTVVYGETLSPGSYEVEGPFTLIAGEELRAVPLLVVPASAEFEADWSER